MENILQFNFFGKHNNVNNIKKEVSNNFIELSENFQKSSNSSMNSTIDSSSDDSIIDEKPKKKRKNNIKQKVKRGKNK